MRTRSLLCNVYLEREAASGVVFALSDAVHQHFNLPVDASFLRPVQNTLLQRQAQRRHSSTSAHFSLLLSTFQITPFLLLYTQRPQHLKSTLALRTRSFFHSLCFLDSYLVLLLQFGYHDNNWWLLLPGHLPEVIHRVHHRTLSGDVRLIVPQVTLQNEPITQQGQHPSQNDECIPPPGSISSIRQNLPGFPKTSWRHVQRKNLLHFGIHS